MSNSSAECTKRPVKYVYSDQVCKLADSHPRVRNRASIVHDLIVNFKLLEAENVQIVRSKLANEHDLKLFHSSDYVELLARFNEKGESEANSTDYETEESDDDDFEVEGADSSELELFGLVYDCAPFRRLWGYVQAIAGSTISAFDEISKYLSRSADSGRLLDKCNGNGAPPEAAPIVINWFGGWHHAHRDCAAGFCYVNDIVIGILRLLAASASVSPPKPKRSLILADSQPNSVRQCEPAVHSDARAVGDGEVVQRSDAVHVLYIDLDAHHGDAVQTAFYASCAVYTISLHRYTPGFYPVVSGSPAECGERGGAYASLNIPLKAGCTDAQFARVCGAALREAHRSFAPRCIVLQCGADALSGDPSGAQFSLTPAAYVEMLREVAVSLFANVPLVVLGGGGYVQTNAARLWTALTSVCVSNRFDADVDVPAECAFAELYAPLLSTRIEPARVPNENSDEQIDRLVADIVDHFEKFRKLHCQR